LVNSEIARTDRRDGSEAFQQGSPVVKLGIITDGISQDVEVAFGFLRDSGIEYADLQFIWGKEIGDQTDDEVWKVKRLMKQYGIKIGCLTRHNFRSAGQCRNNEERCL